MPASNAGQLPDGPILPQSTRKLLEKISPQQRHPGLQLDKLSSAGKMEGQKSALVKVTKTLRDTQLLANLFARRQDTLATLRAKCLIMTTRGSLTLHLSRSGALENAGIALHPVYGFVYLPGSGIKGLVRAWAETVWAASQSDKKKAWQTIEEAFGWSPQSENHKFPQPKKGLSGWRPREIESPQGAAAGRLVFHDAWPTCWPRLILDVVNNHHPKYYKGEDDPGDWEDPTLVYFLAVGVDEKFEFAISDRKRGSNDLLETACGWLRNALTVEGAGAKTAAGYGRFKLVEGKASTTPSPVFAKAGFASESFDLKLVTPAFLAGANQKEEDCDLRPATLRGLLRWWWRTMHAAHLGRDSLRQLETAVWGDAKSGGPVRIAVDLVEGNAPVTYDYKDKFRPKPEFKKQNDLQDPPNKKTTQGLFYASYGMDDDRTKEKKRWYRPAGTIWHVTLSARAGRFEGVSLISLQLLEQVMASLWLLCRFGGVGSKGRKGFGSFADIKVAHISSVQDCKEHAQAFRKTCQLQSQVGKTHSSALEQMKPIEVTTFWKNPWTALDQLGYVTQAFAQRYAHKEEKKVLGLPKKIHGPLHYPIGHHPIGHQKQNPQDHRPPWELSAKKGKRHAAPVHYHLAKSSDVGLVIRATAFPAHHLPSLGESEKMLGELLSFLETDLKDRTKQYQNIGQDNGHQVKVRPSLKSQDALSRPPHYELVEAVLVGKSGKRNLWQAQYGPNGYKMHIQNSNDVPDDKQPGDRVQLYVAPNNAFDWPTEKVRNRYEQKRQRSGRAGRSGQQRSRQKRH